MDSSENTNNSTYQIPHSQYSSVDYSRISHNSYLPEFNNYFGFLSGAPQNATIDSEPNEEKDEENLVCTYCMSRFTCKRGLSQHVGKVHKNFERTVNCRLCGKNYKHDSALKSHIKQVHEKTTRVVCTKCGRSIYNKYMLKAHMKKEHPAKANIS